MIKYIGEYLKSKTEHSSLRLNVFLTIITCCISILIVIVSEAYVKLSNWAGAALVITALGTVIGIALWGKNAGKDKE